MNELEGRLALGFTGVVLVVALGTTGYWYLGDGRWALGDCLYMSIVTLTTVGYAEVLEGFGDVEHARLFNAIVIVLGIGVFLYFVSTLTAYIIEGDLRRSLESTRMRKRISRLRDHIIVCGAGDTGRHVISELLATRTPIVAIDSDSERLEELARELSLSHPGADFVYLCGDATDDAVLEQAGLEYASGLIAALANDKDNLFLVVSARQGHPSPERFRIVARGVEVHQHNKLRRAGADAVVSPNFIGGMRIASEMVRPTVVRFIDDMLKEDDTTRIEEVSVSPESMMIGRTVRELEIRQRANVSILAARRMDDTGYTSNPGPEFTIESGMVLVVLGTHDDIIRLREMAGV